MVIFSDKFGTKSLDGPKLMSSKSPLNKSGCWLVTTLVVAVGAGAENNERMSSLDFGAGGFGACGAAGVLVPKKLNKSGSACWAC